MLLENKKLAIIGAGPVGLTMARLLQLQGADVTIYERDKNAQARIWGGTLDLHKDSGQPALAKAGLLESYFAKAIPMGRTITDHEGRAIFCAPPQCDTPEINRNDLRTILLNSLAEDTVVWNRKCTGLEINNGKWLIHFENETTAIADIVIGANGGMSAMRKYVTDATVVDTGTFIIQGEVKQPQIECPEFYQLCAGNILMTAHEGNLLVANPNNDGALTYAMFFKTPVEWASGNGLDFLQTESIAAFLLSRCVDWHGHYQQLFRATSFFAGLPTRKISLDEPWKEGRSLPLTLIGDAAHLMPPFAGKGVNTGLMDALVLSDNLTNGKFETIAAAISDYEQKMKLCASAAQLESAKNEAEMHDPGFSFVKRFAGEGL